ncbi:LysR family transcriptional regulator [Thiohalobacter sp. IOR34]|uniref:LysR family transcriptional regulator n=1 Tax=Thiohalobacter sp. IOR34 TaxID=3057176 RepID=UPI0025B18958|nr:LysR family transcriptional regulator [Thiohalobacter sp. IOR34]WJW75865.1 LysR family transcriptional regulator [Thiohalobacter sp. IOR34]
MAYSTADKLIRHLTLRQLQIFEAVVRLGGYTRAAGELHLTQPTISMQIRKLSETLGQLLLEQVGRHIQPTQAGREVYAAARDILDRMVSLEETTNELERIVKGPLRIAVITTAKYFMPHLLGAFIDRYPQVEPHLVVTNRSKVLTRLKSNEDDLLIMGQVPEYMDVEAHPFVDNELVVVAHARHPLARRKKPLTLAQLCKERFLVREPGSGTRLAVDRLFAGQGLKINPYMELGSSEAIKQAVMAGLGLSVLSRHNLRLELECGHIAVLKVEGFPLIRSWYAVHLRGKKLPLVPRTFLEFLLRQGKDMMAHQPAAGQANA